MKNDLRISYPLWMICFILLIVASVYLVGTTAVVEDHGAEGVLFMLNLESKLIPFFILFILLIGSLVVFFIKIFKHNRNDPNRKFSLFYLKPPEYIEDDELFQQATGWATKKVYTFFVTAIPLLALLFILLPIGRMWMVIGVLLLGVMQYLIYYIEIRKYVSE